MHPVFSTYRIPSIISYLNRMISPDTIIPDPGNVLDWDRFAYSRNNPVKYNDPTGHAVDDPGDDCTWWDEFTPIYIMQNVPDDLQQHELLVAYMIEHPEYNSSQDNQISEAGFDRPTTESSLALYKFLAEASRADMRLLSKQELINFAQTIASTIAAGIILQGPPGRRNTGRGLWRITEENSVKSMQHDRFGNFYKSKSDGLWWVKDNAGHGDSTWKVYSETGKGLEWRYDANEYGDFITGKHKGPTGVFIPWNELHGR